MGNAWPSNRAELLPPESLVARTHPLSCWRVGPTYQSSFPFFFIVTKPVSSLDTERIHAPLCFAKFVALNQPPSSYKAPGIFLDLLFPSSWHRFALERALDLAASRTASAAVEDHHPKLFFGF